jgi:hypothetical protein
MYAQMTSRAGYVSLMGVSVGTMHLCELSTRSAGHQFEELEGRFSDQGTEREYPDFEFRLVFTRDYTPEAIRNSIVAWLELRKITYRDTGA